MKKLLCILLVLCMLFSLSGCAEKILGSAVFLFLVAAGDDSADKDEVFEFVCEKEYELLKAIEDEDFSAFENKGFIKSIDADAPEAYFSTKQEKGYEPRKKSQTRTVKSEKAVPLSKRGKFTKVTYSQPKMSVIKVKRS